MMEDNRLSDRQCFFVVFLMLMGNLVRVKNTMRSEWLFFLMAAVWILPVSALYCSAFCGDSPRRVLRRSFGRPLGGVLTVLCCLLALLLAGDAIRLFSDFIVINDLNNAGAWGNAFLMVLVVLLLLLCEPGVLGRAAWLIQPVCFSAVALSVILTVNRMDVRQLLPLWDPPNRPLWECAVRTLSSVLVPFFFAVPVTDGASSRKKRTAVRSAGILACLLLCALRVRDLSVLGYPAAVLFRYPSYVAANVLQHSEVLISTAFVLCQPFRAAVCLRYVHSCLPDRSSGFRRCTPFLLVGLSVLFGLADWKSAGRIQPVSEAISLLFCLVLSAAVLLARRSIPSDSSS